MPLFLCVGELILPFVWRVAVDEGCFSLCTDMVKEVVGNTMLLKSD